MNLQDPVLNPAAVDEVASEATFKVGGVTMSEKELVTQCYSALIRDALVKGDMLRDAVRQIRASSTHSADLLEALEDGADFRIAFRKKGDTDWTRVRVVNQDLLQVSAQEEVLMRQQASMKNLAYLLGVNDFIINNI